MPTLLQLRQSERWPIHLSTPTDVVKVAHVDLVQLNFAYNMAGPNVPWRPIRAFDDSSHVYIQMAPGMKTSEAPALLINAGSGTQMVNYRVEGNYYMVDRLFNQAILVRAWDASRTA